LLLLCRWQKKNSMKNITTTQKITLVITLVMVAALFGYVRLYTYLNEHQKKLVELEQKLDVVDVMSESQQEAKHFFTSTKTGREELTGRFVSTEDPTSFWEQIDAVVATAGVTVEKNTIEVDSVKEDALVAKYPKELQGEVRLMLSVEGEWENVYYFLKLLEQFPYVLSVLNVTMELVDRESLGGLWKGNIQVVARTK